MSILSRTAAVAAALALCTSLAARAEEEPVLNIYNWADYIAPDTVKAFEKETGIKVRYDNFDSNEVLHAKLVAGRTGYDVVVPGSHFAKTQIEGGLLMKLDKNKLPNLKNLDPAIQAQLAKLDPGNEYLVDWLWGYTTVGINADKVKKALGATALPDNAWDLVFKPEYASKLKSCGVAFLDTASEIVPIALNYLGKDPHSKNADDYKAAGALLKSIRPNVTMFASSGSDYIDQMARGELCAVIGWSGDIYIAKDRSKKGQAAAVARSSAAEIRCAAVLRRDGDPQGRQAPGERSQVDQLHHAPRGPCRADQRGVLRQSEQGGAQVRQAGVGQRQGGVSRRGRIENDDRARRA